MNVDVTRFRVRYPEVDRMGIAHHAAYLVWFEIGRTELMRAAGVPYGELEDGAGLYYPVIEAVARYHRPAKYDEELDVRTTIGLLEGVRVRFDYAIVRPGEAEALATGHTVHVATGHGGRPCRPPAALKERLAPWTA